MPAPIASPIGPASPKPIDPPTIPPTGAPPTPPSTATEPGLTPLGSVNFFIASLKCEPDIITAAPPATLPVSIIFKPCPKVSSASNADNPAVVVAAIFSRP